MATLLTAVTESLAVLDGILYTKPAPVADALPLPPLPPPPPPSLTSYMIPLYQPVVVPSQTTTVVVNNGTTPVVVNNGATPVAANTKPKDEKSKVTANILTGGALAIITGFVANTAARVYNHSSQDEKIRVSVERVHAEYTAASGQRIPVMPVELMNAYSDWSTYARWITIASYAETIGLGFNAGLTVLGARIDSPALGWLGFGGLMVIGGYTAFDYLTRNYTDRLMRLRQALFTYYHALVIATTPAPTYTTV